jgi:hypothetical protein
VPGSGATGATGASGTAGVMGCEGCGTSARTLVLIDIPLPYPPSAACQAFGVNSSRFPTGALAAAGLVVGFAVASLTGSRPMGGVVLLAAAAVCALIWLRRHPPRHALRLGGALLAAFVVSHGLGLVIGAWPAVVAVSAATFLACRRWSDVQSQ